MFIVVPEIPTFIQFWLTLVPDFRQVPTALVNVSEVKSPYIIKLYEQK